MKLGTTLQLNLLLQLLLLHSHCLLLCSTTANVARSSCLTEHTNLFRRCLFLGLSFLSCKLPLRLQSCCNCCCSLRLLLCCVGHRRTCCKLCLSKQCGMGMHHKPR
jgi:hypothetical protein